MIELITFHRSTNYGALLQSLSLKEFIEEKLKLKCPISNISTDNFNNINLILKYLKKKNKNIR